MKKLFALALAFGATAASAKDADDCLPGLICASAPATIVKGVQDAGYKAKLDKDDGGDPMVSSSASGYDYDIYFYDCEAHVQCGSIQFAINFAAEGFETPALVNEWNAANRMGKAYIDGKKRFVLRHDMSTIGGVNSKNFADTVDWWASTLGEMAKFWDKHPNPKAAKKD